MFLRKKVQNGKIYYSLEERLWDAEIGKVKTKVIAGLGQKPRAGLWELFEEGKIEKKEYSQLIEKLPPEEHTRKTFTVQELLRIKERIDFPNFARGLIWEHEQKSSFILSVIEWFPLPELCLYPQLDGHYLLLDGKQRLDCIYSFIDNDFCMISELSNTNGKRFSELSEEQQDALLNAPIPVLILNRNFSDEALGEIFIRLNKHF